jgi:steroid delta-isomerase-like uncharacterized protein
MQPKGIEGVTVGNKFDRLDQSAKLAEQHRYDELREFYRSDVRGWSPSYDFEGIDSWLALLAKQNDPFSEIETRQSLVAETEETVVTEWTWAATHTGTIEGDGFELPATGKRISMKGLSVFEFSDGKIASFRQYWDNADVMAQFS